MAIYETIPIIKLSKKNEIISPIEDLPELVHLYDNAKYVFIDFAKKMPATTTPKTSIDDASHEMQLRHSQILLVENEGAIVGLISYDDMRGEKPLKLLEERRLPRKEVTVEMLMRPAAQIHTLDYSQLKNAQVGHIVNTIKKHHALYILVVKRLKLDQQIIRGLFSASQISKQLHIDISAILTKSPETIIELHLERKI